MVLLICIENTDKCLLHFVCVLSLIQLNFSKSAFWIATVGKAPVLQS